MALRILRATTAAGLGCRNRRRLGVRTVAKAAGVLGVAAAAALARRRGGGRIHGHSSWRGAAGGGLRRRGGASGFIAAAKRCRTKTARVSDLLVVRFTKTKLGCLPNPQGPAAPIRRKMPRDGSWRAGAEEAGFLAQSEGRRRTPAPKPGRQQPSHRGNSALQRSPSASRWPRAPLPQ